MQFFETVMGRRFFEGQLPSLIKAVNRLADAVEKANELAANGKEVIASMADADRCE